MNTAGGWQVWNVKWQSLCCGHQHVSRLPAGLPLLPLLPVHEDGWMYETLIGQARGSQRERRALHSSSLLLRFTSPWTPQCAARPSARPHLESSSRVNARTMDATIYQIIFGELGDLNCSLIDAFQDTFLENASLSFLSTDGEMKLFLFYV